MSIVKIEDVARAAGVSVATVSRVLNEQGGVLPQTQEKVKKAADIVIVSTGGYPKDINLYQAQKSIDNVKHIVRDKFHLIITGGVYVIICCVVNSD